VILQGVLEVFRRIFVVTEEAFSRFTGISLNKG
jgi:hypothetical protein